MKTKDEVPYQWVWDDTPNKEIMNGRINGSDIVFPMEDFFRFWTRIPDATLQHILKDMEDYP
jgi:hypothetical protein